MSRADEIRENLAAVERRIATACERAGRERGEVRLVAVSKTFPSSDVELAIAAGITELGENRVQELRRKRNEVKAGAVWHLIGHLQSNKTNEAVRIADVVQSVDSIELATRLARAAEAEGKVQEVLLQVNIGREPQKSGIDPSDAPRLATAVSAFPTLRLTGLMAIPPVGEADAMRPYFRELRALRDGAGLPELSIGMTDDFEVAIEEGATLVRVGRAIFGSRQTG
jgi:pyridoxal phosphate enzyme (YggS family)